jgi:hypothetical protein
MTMHLAIVERVENRLEARNYHTSFYKGDRQFRSGWIHINGEISEAMSSIEAKVVSTVFNP